MNLSQKGRVAVVTGGSRGIGRAVAERLAEEGADIAIIYAGNHIAADETVEKIAGCGVKCQAYRCDVSDFAACAETVASITADFGRIDILVNNAGITRDAPTPIMSEESFDAVIDTNLKGAFNMIRHSCREFMRHGGKIINISSTVALTGNRGQANYCASKAGLMGLTKSVARELASRKVTCNCVAPGFIVSDMTNAMTDEAKAGMTEKIPAARAGNAEEVADAVAFLASDMAMYITGEVLRVDGGLAM